MARRNALSRHIENQAFLSAHWRPSPLFIVSSIFDVNEDTAPDFDYEKQYHQQ
jgi:hypothetical protein